MKKIFYTCLWMMAVFVLPVSAAQTLAERPSFIVKPYLQWATQQSMLIKWETESPMAGWVEYGQAAFDVKSAELSHKTAALSLSKVQTVELKGLESETAYFYRVGILSHQGDTLYSDIYPFQTAVHAHTPIGFVVFSDSQGRPNPDVWGQIAKVAERERPHFGIHAGDQVDRGHDRSNWLGQFFPQGQSFMSKYVLYSILGNHEDDAPSYHRYLGHPSGARCYSFVYGDTEFFMFDSNQDVAVGSQVYQQLETALSRSSATWKIVVHHHPIYSSDENDFGDTRFARSRLGPAKMAHLPKLYDRYGVDVVFYGHVHTYERTWPIKDGKANPAKGTVYIQIGGSGGGLEQPAPMRSWYTNKLKYGHHFGSVRIAGNELHFQGIDIDGQVFDQFVLKK